MKSSETTGRKARNLNGLLKLASPWLRRLKGMSPKQLKRVPLTSTLLNLIDDDKKFFWKPVGALDAYRHPKEVYAHTDTPIQAAKHVIDHYNVPSPWRNWYPLKQQLEMAQARLPGQLNNLYDLTRLAKKPLGNTAIERRLAKANIEEIGYYLKDLGDQKKELKNLELQRTVGTPITYEEFLRSNPVGETLFKGGYFKPEEWKISEPGWASGRDSVAESYALSPTWHSGNTDIPMIHTVPIKNSKSLRTGKNFFTGHVSERGKNARRIANHDQKYWHSVATSSDRYPNYETVINGNEMRNMPWRTYEQIIPEDLEHIPVKKILREQVTPGDLGIKFQQVNTGVEPQIKRKLEEIAHWQRGVNNLRTIIQERFKHPINGYDMEYDPLLKTKPELPFWERGGLKDLLLYFGGRHGAEYGEL